MLEEYVDQLTVSFDGSDEIDVDTLTIVLDNTVKALKKIAQQTIEERYEKFIIRDVRKGSFVVDLVGVIGANIGMLKNVQTAISIFKTALDIKKHLLGEDPKSVVHANNYYHIENLNGDILNVDDYVYNAYTLDSELDDRLTNISKVIAEDPHRSSLNITAESGITNVKSTTSLTKEVAKQIDKPVDLSKLNQNYVSEVVRSRIRVKKPDFEGNSMWQFVILGDAKSAKILDEDFKSNLTNYKFTKGTLLDVDLRISFVMKPDGSALNNKKEYSVVKVHNVLNENETEQLNFFE